MKIEKVVYDDGYVGQYISDFKPGDLITTYEKGYHIFIKYVMREGECPLVHYKKEYNSNGTKCKSKFVTQCDSSYCRPARKCISEEIKRRKREIKQLEAIKKTCI